MRLRKRFLPYAVAIGSTAIALLLALGLEPFLTQVVSPFFFVAITVSTWYGGLKPGFVSIVLSALAINHFFVPSVGPVPNLSISDVIRFITFCLVAVVIHLLSRNLRNSKRRVEQLSQQLLEESAEQLRIALSAAQMGLWDWNIVTGEIKWSPEHEQLFGITDNSFDGRFKTVEACLHPDDREKFNQALERSLKQRVPYEHEFRVVWADGSIHWIEGRGQAFYNETGQPVRMTGTVMAIDQRKQAEATLQQQFEQQRLVMEMTQRIRRSLNLQDILQTTVDEVRQFLQCDRVIIFRFSPGWGGTVVVESVADEWMRILPLQIYDPCIGEEYVEPFKQGLVTAKTDIYNSEISPCHVEFLASLQVRANLVVPIFQGDELWGLLAAHHCAAPREWQSSEIVLLRQLGAQVSIALQQSELFEQVQTELAERKQAQMALQQLNAELEQRVAERTAQLREVNDRLLETLIALRESEERRRLALDLTHIGFWDWHLPSSTLIWNDNHFTLLGLASHDNDIEPTYELWRSHIHSDDLSWVEQRFLESIENHTDYTAEYRVVHWDGSVHWLMGRAKAIYDESGQPVRSLGVLLDISDRKQSEAALQQQSQQEQLLLKITQSIRQSLDLKIILNTAVTEVRQTLQTDRAAVYRFNPDLSGNFVVESVGTDWVNLVEPDICQIWEDTYLQKTQGGRFRNHESFVIADIYTAGLEPCHIELLEQFQAKAYAVAPIFSGEVLWGLLAIYQNATPRQWQSWEVELLQQITNQLSIAIQQSELYRQLQIELHERKQAAAVLREADRRWRSLLDNVQLLVVGLDQTGAVNYVNPFFLNLTGYTQQEVVGKNWFESFLPQSDQQSIQAIFSDVLTQNAYPYYQNPILTKSGEERFITWNNTMLHDSVGTTIGTISIGEDITERQKVEQMKNEFIGIVSHELRTPLTAIKMSLGLLKSGIYDKKPDKFQRMLEIALIDTNRLVNLVNDILDLERLDSGRAVLEKTLCPAENLMQQAIDGVQVLATPQQIKLTIAPTDAQVWVAADAIIQSLTNLLSNAIKFSPANSTITLSAEYQTDVVLFQVSDQGRGIPADKLETIFGRFQQVDVSDARQKGGTGLGLAICRSIIEQHGGKIWAESTLGEGSTLLFTLPLPPEEIE
jgi:PAS domain S-box-containing protein